MTAPAAQTLVSCLYDLERRDGSGRRTLAAYLEHGEYVLGLPHPLVLFLDPELEGWAREGRRRRGLEDLTLLVPEPLEQLDLYAIAPLVARFQPPRNARATKDTPLFDVVQWSKLDLVLRAMHHDPFGTEHFAWIDLGIAHVAEPPPTFPAPSGKVSVLQMVAVDPAEVADRRDFYSLERGRVAGGFLRGRRDFLRALAAEFQGELASALVLRLRPNEQMVLGVLTACRPELFEPYFGDYRSILCNWDFVRRDLDTVFLNLAHCRTRGLWSEGLRVCRAVEASIRAGALAPSPDERARWLDEFFVASWYGAERERCPALARDLEALAGADYWAEHGERLRGNLALLRGRGE